MQKSLKEKNVYAFIDSQNLNLGVLSLGKRLDFHKFRVYLRDQYNVTQAYLFIGHVDGNESLYTTLQKDGYLLVFKPTLKRKEGGKAIVKGNVDAELVLHTMIEFDNYDQAIIVSGDGDFHCLVEHLTEKNKLMKLITPNRKYSSLLKKFAKDITSVESFIKMVEKRRRGIPAVQKPLVVLSW
jgi:uncharacterized LabA/DUF88 family protein